MGSNRQSGSASCHQNSDSVRENNKAFRLAQPSLPLINRCWALGQMLEHTEVHGGKRYPFGSGAEPGFRPDGLN